VPRWARGLGVSLDNLVGQGQQLIENFEAERLRRDEVIARSNWLGGLHH